MFSTEPVQSWPKSRFQLYVYVTPVTHQIFQHTSAQTVPFDLWILKVWFTHSKGLPSGKMYISMGVFIVKVHSVVNIQIGRLSMIHNIGNIQYNNLFEGEDVITFLPVLQLETWPWLFKRWIELSNGQITIQRISIRSSDCTVHWIEIYIHLLSSWALVDKTDITYPGQFFNAGYWELYVHICFNSASAHCSGPYFTLAVDKYVSRENPMLGFIPWGIPFNWGLYHEYIYTVLLRADINLFLREIPLRIVHSCIKKQRI